MSNNKNNIENLSQIMDLYRPILFREKFPSYSKLNRHQKIFQEFPN